VGNNKRLFDFPLKFGGLKYRCNADVSCKSSFEILSKTQRQRSSSNVDIIVNLLCRGYATLAKQKQVSASTVAGLLVIKLGSVTAAPSTMGFCEPSQVVMWLQLLCRCNSKKLDPVLELAKGATAASFQS